MVQTCTDQCIGAKLPTRKTSSGLFQWLCLTIELFNRKVLGNFKLPLVAIRQQLCLVVQELFVSFSSEFEIRPLHDRVHWTRFLAKPTVNALGHVNVIACRTTCTVRPWLLQATQQDMDTSIHQTISSKEHTHTLSRTASMVMA